MSHPNSGASRFAGRLFKTALTSAFAFSAVAGGVLLSGGEAKAISTVCVPSSGQLPASCTTTGDSVVSPFTNTASVVSSTLPAGTFVNLEGTGLAYGFSQQQIDTDFNPPLTGASVTSIYTIVTDPSTPFDQVDLSWVNVPGTNSTVSALYEWAGGSVTLDKNTPLFKIEGPLPSTIKVTNTYTPGNGAIDNAQNTFRNVPGPLPILGAGAAFGFSRKLRSRIKAGRTA